jgi:GR25 family glycosyltransferase involved in LPS biosynthesis
MFVGWEGVGLSSYLLINFWFTRIQANKSAIKAMLINRIGDFFLLLATFTLYFIFNTFNYDNKTLKKYLSDFINHNDIIIDINLNNKINFIDHIVWINLNRSIKRREHMENLLSNIIIKNTRIEAIDGKIDDVKSMIYPIKTKDISNFEIATTLSHIKAINYLKDIEGDYFLVCEDDINFDNIYLIDTNLEEIIKKSPEFDILLITKIYWSKLDNLYTCWNTERSKKGLYDSTIWSAACYVISRKGINNICNLVSFHDNIFKFNINYIHVADLFLFEKSNTYVYKYNFINTIDKNSTIHCDHLEGQIKSSNFQLNIIKDSYYNYILHNKINFVDHILWINLEKSNDRKIYMENILKNINIKKTRINAIYGDNLTNNLSKLKNNERQLSIYEIATTLSHIKAINHLKNNSKS